MDLEKFFDRVNHDILMSRVARKVRDKRVLLLIRRFLQAGVLVDGAVSPRSEGTPQGGPLSPLLSNVLLDELDKELERRGHRFVRYADDCNVYVQSEAAGAARTTCRTPSTACYGTSSFGPSLQPSRLREVEGGAGRAGQALKGSISMSRGGSISMSAQAARSTCGSARRRSPV